MSRNDESRATSAAPDQDGRNLDYTSRTPTDADGAALAEARVDREAAWLRVLETAADFERAWQYENELREDVHRRREGRIRELHAMSEDAAGGAS